MIIPPNDFNLGRGILWKKLFKIASGLVILLAVVFLLLWQSDSFLIDAPPSRPVASLARRSFSEGGSPVASTSTNALVTRAVDGDTLKVLIDGEDDEVTIRLLGVNTPETVDPRRPVECFGKEASLFTHEKTDGKRVRLEDDPQADEIDKYGRLLRNVILSDGTDFNAELIRQGYAYAYVSFPLTMSRKAELLRLEAEARNAKRGLWNPEVCG